VRRICEKRKFFIASFASSLSTILTVVAKKLRLRSDSFTRN